MVQFGFLFQLALKLGLQGGEAFGKVEIVFVLRIGSGELAFTGFQAIVEVFERVRDVLEEDQAQNDMLVLGRVDILAKLVSGLSKLLFKRFFFDLLLRRSPFCHMGCFLLCLIERMTDLPAL